jgi:hypothetical protein
VGDLRHRSGRSSTHVVAVALAGFMLWKSRCSRSPRAARSGKRRDTFAPCLSPRPLPRRPCPGETGTRCSAGASEPSISSGSSPCAGSASARVRRAGGDRRSHRPHNGDWNRFLLGELQSLCRDCHARKWATDAKGGKPEIGYSREIGPDGWPIDPRHPANRGRLAGGH